MLGAVFGKEIRDERSEIPRRELIGMRNRLAHGYFGINNATLWHVVEIEVPKLLQTLQTIVVTRPELFKGQA